MKFAAAATIPGRANSVQNGTEPSAKSTQTGALFGIPHSRDRAWACPGRKANNATQPRTRTRSRFTTLETLAIRANEEAASALLDQDVAEAGAAEQEPELTLGVVEDRAVVDHLVAELPYRALEPVPAGEARHRRPAAHFGHAADVQVRVRLVVEEAEGDDDVELALERRGQEVAVDERHLVSEALQPLFREVEHLLGDVRVHPLARARLEDELADATRAAADVEHARRVVLADDVEGEVAPLQEPGPDGALERMLLVVQRVKRRRLLAKVISDELRS